MDNCDDLFMSKVLQGDIPHVFCCFPDVYAFHTEFYYTTSGYKGAQMTTNHTHTAHKNFEAERSPARIYATQVRSGGCASSIYVTDY